MSRRLGDYVPLSVSYADDDAILLVSPMAELLFVRVMALAGSLPTDGYLTEAQVVHRASRKLGTERKVRALARELVDQGLWLEQDGGYVVRAWLKWNKSAEQLGRERANDRQRKRQERGRNPDGDPSESDGIPASVRPDSDRTATGLQTDTDRSPASRTGERAGVRRVVTTKGSNDSTQNVSAQNAQTPPESAGAVAGPAITQRSKAITDEYAAAEPMCKWPAVNAIVIRAIKAGRYADAEIRDALLRLAAEPRGVTVETLRVELDGLPAGKRSRSGHQPYRNPVDESEYDLPMFPSQEGRE